MSRAAPVLIAVALVTCRVLLPAQDSSAAQQSADKAFEFVQRGDLKSAETELRKALKLSPNDPTLLTSLGGILGMEGQLEPANLYLAKAVKLKPDDALLRRNLAANEWQLGRLREAREQLELLLHADPSDKRAVFLLGMVCEREKNYTRSIALLESIPDIAEQQPEALVALASSYYHTNRRENARSALKTLLNRHVEPHVMYLAGVVAMDAHDYALAESLLEPIRSTYGNSDVYLLLCNILAGRGAYLRALQIATEAVHVFPDSYQLFLTKAETEMKLRYFSQAVDSAKKAVELHPAAETKRELAIAEWHVGNRKQAISDFEEVMRQFPRDGRNYEAYGTLLLEDESPESKTRGILLLKKALAADDSSVEARYQLANAELADGHLQAALQYLERAIQTNPDDSRLHFAMSRVYRRLGRDSDADREMEKYQKLKAAEQPSARTSAAVDTQH